MNDDCQTLLVTANHEKQDTESLRSHASFTKVRHTRAGKERRASPFFLIAVLFGTFVYLRFNGPTLEQASHTIWNLCHPNKAYDDIWDDFLDVATSPEELSNHTSLTGEIPQYVLDYAPLVHLYSEEKFWPCDIAEHLFHVTPELDYTPIQGRAQNMNLTNLDKLNEFEEGRHVYLTSDDNVEERPDWLGGQKNIPDDFTEERRMPYIRGARSRPGRKKFAGQSHGGRSDAPAVLVTVDKGKGIVDAFWFYFYSYNLGNVVFNVRFGNHVGDWEHSLIRFKHGKPKLVFFSEHNFGQAYTYNAVEKIGKRVSSCFLLFDSDVLLTQPQPVVYSATGTHAMYATPGSHPYILPLGILHDETDRGPLWDPALNSHMYTYNHLNDVLHPSNITPSAPTEWFYFGGKWGDKFYPLDDDRQYGILGEYHYVSGPLGPRFKHLGRRKVCQGRYTDPCVIKDRLSANEIRVWPGLGNGEDLEWDGFDGLEGDG